MTDPLPTTPGPVPSDLPQNQSIDGVLKASTPKKEATSVVTDKEKSRMKKLLLIIVSVPYALYLLWSFFLLSVLPSASGQYDALISVGSLVAIVALVVILLGTLFIVKHVFSVKNVSKTNQLIGLLKVLGVAAPGVLLSLFVPVMIAGEPSLYLAIVEPDPTQEIVAPVAITFSVQDSVDILKRRDLTPISYIWDYDGDGKKEDETVVPTATSIFDRQGVYTVKTQMKLSDGSTRNLARTLVIPRAVFSTTPLKPIIDEAVRFSVSHLLEIDEKLPEAQQVTIKEVRWDFDEDGEIDEIVQEPEVVHIFRKKGPVKVSATMVLSNQVQQSFERTIEIYGLPTLPFAVELLHEPEYLFSPPPFGVIFRIESPEKISDVTWDFGNGKKAEGMRVSHTYGSKGAYPVSAEVRTESGSFARLTTLVQVVDTLSLPDLAIDGTPAITGDQKNLIIADLPAILDLTPRTSVPLIDFIWEAPGATVVDSTETQLKAVYRRAGTYPIALIARDTEGRAMRKNFTLEVRPVSESITIRMTPDGGVAPLLVRFDASETVIPGEEITGFEWFFESDKNTVPKQGGAQIEYLFQQPGTYQVRLKTYTTSGQTFETTRTIVVRAPILDACFFASRTSGKAPLGVKFDMSCTSGAPTTVEWDFGDGSQTDERNPIHVFEDAGVYQVTLTVQDSTGGISKEISTITAK